MKFVSTLFFILLISNTESAFAQLDSSYELLLGTPVPATATPTTSTQPRKSVKPKRKLANEPIPEAPVAEPVRPLPAKVMTAEETTALEPSLSVQAQSLLNSQPEKVLSYYQEQFEDSDPRQNRVEITFAPTFITNESSSNYSFRNYRSVFSALAVGANVWLTPAIGIGGNFLFSLGGDTSGDAATGTRSPARHEFFDVALKFREFFGFSSLSKSVEFDILYSDYKFNVPSDDLYRARLKTSGVGLKASLRLPSSADVAWIVGGSFFPKLQHSESAAGTPISSGENSENVRIGLQLGAEVKLSKGSQVFWEASASSERNLFGGNASTADPATGGIPKNVSVSNSFYLTSFGYRWGN